MRIGIFTDFSLPHIGGVETSIFHQHRALTEAGHKVYTISPPMKGPDEINDQLEDIIRIRSPLPIRFDGADIYHYNRRANSIIDELNLDIVHVESEFNMGCFGVRYARKRGLPVFYTAHTFYPPQIELFIKQPRATSIIADIAQRKILGKYRANMGFDPEDNYMGIPCSTYAQKKILNVWMRFAASTDVMLAPSKRMKDYVEHFVKGKPMYYVPNPFASSLTDANHEAAPVHRPIKFATTSVLRPEKRVDMIVEAISRLNDSERAKLTLDIFGGGIMYRPIEKMVAKHNLQSMIRLHGPVDNRVIHKALIDNDVMISMSVGFDNQPMTILEAIHAGNAIIYCDQYLKEGTDGDNAFFAEPGIEGLTAAIRKTISDDKRVDKMKKNSKSMAEEYTYKSFAAKYEDILKDVL
jgi:glycosyltransferase involved in cell wall biosynthesis